VGTLFDTQAGTQSPEEIVKGVATALPSPGDGDGPFVPMAINDKGDVLGYASNASIGNTIMFLLQDGAFNGSYSVPLVEPGDAQSAPPLPISLTNNLLVSFNVIYSIETIGTGYGKPPNFRSVPAQNRFTHVNSVNASDTVAGTAYSFNGITSVYTGKGKNFVTVTPPNAKNVIGGYINKAGEVAGSFEDNSGVWHGFVYSGGNVTVFDPPQVNGANTQVTTNAINVDGRVVGSFTDSTGAQHGFLYNGATVSSFGTYAAGDVVTVAISNTGLMAVSDSAGPAAFASAIVKCSGSGC
jgi:probable HAF family extracellular repeat protein